MFKFNLMSGLRLLALLVPIATVACAGPWKQAEVTRLGLDDGPYSSIRLMLKGGRVVEARQRLAELPVTVRETPQWSYLMGRALLLDGDADRAAGYLEDAHRRLPDSVVVTNDLGVALVRADRAGQALPLFDAVLAAHPDDRDLMLNRAVALMGAGRNVPSQQALSLVARRYPDWFDARFNHALAAMKAGDPQTAVFEFRQAERLRPGDRDTLLGLAAACARFQDPVCSEQAVRKVVSRYPEDPLALMAWGNHLEEAGKLDEAVQAYGKATQVAPGCSNCWYCLGRTADRMGNEALAVRALNRHLETSGDEKTARQVRMRLREIEEGGSR